MQKRRINFIVDTTAVDSGKSGWRQHVRLIDVDIPTSNRTTANRRRQNIRSNARHRIDVWFPTSNILRLIDSVLSDGVYPYCFTLSKLRMQKRRINFIVDTTAVDGGKSGWRQQLDVVNTSGNRCQIGEGYYRSNRWRMDGKPDANQTS